MARFAGRRESCADVIRIRGTGIVTRVTGVTARIHKLVVVVRVTRLTRRREVNPGQRKLRRCMVKGRRLPRRRRVTELARRREST